MPGEVCTDVLAGPDGVFAESDESLKKLASVTWWLFFVLDLQWLVFVFLFFVLIFFKYVLLCFVDLVLFVEKQS